MNLETLNRLFIDSNTEKLILDKKNTLPASKQALVFCERFSLKTGHFNIFHFKKKS